MVHSHNHIADLFRGEDGNKSGGKVLKFIIPNEFAVRFNRPLIIILYCSISSRYNLEIISISWNIMIMRGTHFYSTPRSRTA